MHLSKLVWRIDSLISSECKVRRRVRLVSSLARRVRLVSSLATIFSSPLESRK